jgi:LmbE family N-acetylglucosaminyl deacetylase
LRLLCVTAHPDDEAGNFGGCLLHYHARGVETYVICMTPGTAATHRGAASSNAELAEIRRREFAASCRILNVSHGEVLNYPDAALDRVPFLDAVSDLIGRIRRIRPHVIITFGTEGGLTAHPDHSMVALFTTAATHWAARTNRFAQQLELEKLQPHRAQKLYYATASFTLSNRQPVALAPSTAVIEIGPYLQAKIAAFKAHQSQAPLFPIFENMVRQRGTGERFILANASSPRDVTFENDLFAGVEDSA